MASTTGFGERKDPRLVVGLGDSVPTGTRADGPDFVRLLGRWIHQRWQRPVRVVNLAVPGLTTRLLNAQLALPGVRGPVAKADLIVLTIGANDFAQSILRHPDGEPLERALAQLRRRVARVIRHILRIRRMRTTGLLLTGYWNVFTDGVAATHLDPAHRATADELTRRANAVLAEVAAEYGVVCVDLYPAFKGQGDVDPTPWLASDGDHPNAAGHVRIAGTITDLIEAHLAASKWTT